MFYSYKNSLDFVQRGADTVWGCGGAQADYRLATVYQDVLTFHGYPYTQNKRDPGWWTGQPLEAPMKETPYDDEFFELA
eukprot:1195424-Prorocentrum_minimum.AAC.12